MKLTFFRGAVFEFTLVYWGRKWSVHRWARTFEISMYWLFQSVYVAIEITTKKASFRKTRYIWKIWKWNILKDVFLVMILILFLTEFGHLTLCLISIIKSCHVVKNRYKFSTGYLHYLLEINWLYNNFVNVTRNIKVHNKNFFKKFYPRQQNSRLFWKQNTAALFAKTERYHAASDPSWLSYLVELYFI